jgi:hypothetical protein
LHDKANRIELCYAFGGKQRIIRFYFENRDFNAEEKKKMGRSFIWIKVEMISKA